MPMTDTSEIVERSLLASTPECIHRIRTKTVKALDYRKDDLKSIPTLKEFVVTSEENTVKEIMSCNKILDHMQS